ncbi:hypothetical protein L2E82_28918 [Cichorium intybus]|uniref:Uncharacterized protein n=1 Tax=Cichorium intybus TaxID=13427 RepID=A0ACB9CWQ8_CICIN|nr:hypothetical protein L2E82_28918 [Cichorium intybus]
MLPKRQSTFLGQGSMSFCLRHPHIFPLVFEYKKYFSFSSHKCFCYICLIALITPPPPFQSSLAVEINTQSVCIHV